MLLAGAAATAGFGPLVCTGVVFTVQVFPEGKALGVDSAAAPATAASKLIVLALPIILQQIR